MTNEKPIEGTIRAICLDAHVEGAYMVELIVSKEDAQRITIGKKDVTIKDAKV